MTRKRDKLYFDYELNMPPFDKLKFCAKLHNTVLFGDEYKEAEQWLNEHKIEWAYDIPYFYFASKDDVTQFMLRFG